MPSNQELIDAIKAINPDAVTDELSNAKLSDLLKAEKAAKDEADAKAAAEEAEALAAAEAAAKAEAEAKAAAEAAEAAKAVAKAGKQHKVKTGGAITTLSGIKGEGEVVTAAMLNGGADTLKALVKSGHVVLE